MADQTILADRPTPAEAGPMPGDSVRRHGLIVRLWHWINAVAVIVMLMSGLMISNAHPRLYWGQYGANLDHGWLDLPQFPGWMTIPSDYNLALARHWHLAFAWVLAFAFLAYLVAGLLNRHFRRDLDFTRNELAPSHLWQDIKDHARLRFPTGAAAMRYNTLQKLTYCAVLFALIPLMIATGLCLSPGMNAVLGWLVDLLGGRASARSIHFICAALIGLFIVVHLVLVVLAGPVNEVRAMITGRFVLPGRRAA